MIQRADGTWDIINRIIPCVNITAAGGWVAHPVTRKGWGRNRKKGRVVRFARECRELGSHECKS